MDSTDINPGSHSDEEPHVDTPCSDDSEGFQLAPTDPPLPESLTATSSSDSPFEGTNTKSETDDSKDTGDAKCDTKPDTDDRLVKPVTDDAKPDTDDPKPDTDDTKPDTNDTKPDTDDAKPDTKPDTDDTKSETKSETNSRSETDDTTTDTSGKTVSQQTEAKPSDSSAKDGEGGGWGGWGGWGGSLWSSVSTVAESAQAIGQKVTAVIASVEDTLGVPSPQEMAQERLEERQRLAEEIKEHDVSPEAGEIVTAEPHHADEPCAEDTSQATDPPHDPESVKHENEQDLNFGAVSGFLSDFAAAVQTTSQGLVTGGLGALESLGKKTMEVLSDGDPRLAKKRAMLGVGPSPTLSQLLKEAKSEMVTESKGEGGQLEDTEIPLSYSRLFDEYHGVAHLEALELLSKECAVKMHSMCAGFAGDELKSLQGKLNQLSEAFTIDEDEENLEDDSSQLEEVNELFSDIALPLKVGKLLKVSAGWRERVGHVSEGKGGGDNVEEGAEGAGEEGKSSDKKGTSEALYENGLRSLAEMTSTAIELFRKMAEISLLPDFSKSEPLLQALKFNRLTLLVSNELDALASVHSEAITELELEGTNATVTSLYLESSNSGSYVQDTFQLLLPVLKCSLVQQLQLQQPEPNVLNRN